MFSIEPAILQDLVAGSPSRNPFELARSWHGRAPVLRDLVLKLQAEVTGGYPAGPLFGEAPCCGRLPRKSFKDIRSDGPAWINTEEDFQGPNYGVCSNISTSAST